MYCSTRSTRQQLGFWGELVGAAVTLGSKSIDKSIAKKNVALEQQRMALEDRRAQLELIKLQNQNRIVEMQMAREAPTPSPAFMSKSVTLPGVGAIPLSYMLIPAIAVLAILLLRK